MSTTAVLTRPTSRSATPASATAPAPVAPGPRLADNRWPYLAWGLAWLVGYGAFALARGADPVLALPARLPSLLLVAGLVGAAVVTTVQIVHDSRGAVGAAKTTGTLVGLAWGTGFTALFLLITALSAVLDDHLVETVLWPTGSAVVVGLMYLTGGAVHRDLLQYALGTYLALLGAAAVFVGSPGHYVVLAVAGAPAYLVAAALEGRRCTAALRRGLA